MQLVAADLVKHWERRLQRKLLTGEIKQRAKKNVVVRALRLAYEAAGRISWPGMQYRRDIGAAAVESQGKEPA